MPLIRNMPMVEYQAIKAMSASMAVALVERCPLIAWTNSSFNPNAEREDTNHFDIGTAAHLAVLEPHLFAERTVCHMHSEYRTNEAKAVRDAAYKAGKTPLKPEEATLVSELRKAVMADTDASPLFTEPGDVEVALTWEWNGIPCKARPDRLSHDLKTVTDLKTTTSAEPRAMGRDAFNHGWHVRAAWYMAGIKEVTKVLPSRYCFVPVEKDAPHIVQVYEMEDSVLIRGDQIIGKALDLFAQCQKSGVWPKYRHGISKLRLPGWAEFKYAEMEEMGEL